MSATQSHFEQFQLDALDLDGISVAREDGRVIATRDLTDDTVDLEDVLDLADDHGIDIRNMQVDMGDGEARVILGGDSA
ncbi:hypothetical protein HZS55_15700 [Halosimplex rubrum]|uniref:Uncharacterized protein n=1 Tax=Halosimplex rubrum TaxID=869889 RepID=A0A7D5P5A5_9EURY|nr:hypothetical protein [Halosimplex rubrum]QLH78644.1 hypothetical protein HZS55_15700 [Halosimplex rubrum]